MSLAEKIYVDGQNFDALLWYACATIGSFVDGLILGITNEGIMTLEICKLSEKKVTFIWQVPNMFVYV